MDRFNCWNGSDRGGEKKRRRLTTGSEKMLVSVCRLENKQTRWKRTAVDIQEAFGVKEDKHDSFFTFIWETFPPFSRKTNRRRRRRKDGGMMMKRERGRTASLCPNVPRPSSPPGMSCEACTSVFDCVQVCVCVLLF